MKTLLTTILLLITNSIFSQSWNQIPVNTTEKLNDIEFPSSSVGYIAGDSATFLKSIDGGETWSQMTLNGITINPWSSNIIDVDFVNELVGFIVFDNANDGPYKTIDGGANWTLFSNGPSNMCYKKTMYLNSETDFFLGGAGCFQSAQIENYVDPTWNFSTVNYESFNTSEFVVEMDFKGNIGLAAINGQHMLRSVDSGVTWDTLPAIVGPGTRLTSVMFANSDTCYAGYEDINGGGFSILISTDEGLTWGSDGNSGSFFYPAFLSLGKANNGDVYTGGKTNNDMGILFETTDGVNWWLESVAHPINGIDSYDTDVTFAVGDSGYVIVNQPLGSLGTNDNDDLFSINIFPNPTADFITIDNSSVKEIMFKIVNVNGQTVIDNIDSKNGTTVDLTNLKSGIYYLKPKNKDLQKVHKLIKL